MEISKLTPQGMRSCSLAIVCSEMMSRYQIQFGSNETFFSMFASTANYGCCVLLRKIEVIFQGPTERSMSFRNYSSTEEEKILDRL